MNFYRGLLILLLIIVLLFSFSIATHAGVLGYGARAAGMGGAFTAVANDGTAPYWNPAGITQLQYLTLTPSIGLQGDIALISEIITAGLLADGTLMVGISSKYVGANVFADFGGYGAGNPLAWKGMIAGLAYGALTFGFPLNDDLAWGLNIKKAYGEIQFIEYQTPNQVTVSAAIDGMAYDLGVLYRINDSLRMGLMGRNVAGATTLINVKQKYNNNPETDLPDQDFNLPQSFILGMSFIPYRTALFAIDLETINDLENMEKNQIRLHLGFEQTALWKTLAFRGGVFTDKGRPLGLSAGVGLKLGPVLIDGAASVVGNDPPMYLITGGFTF